MMKHNQCKKILNYMKTHDGITTLEASDKLRITRLPARIYDLKAAGVLITYVWENHYDADGNFTSRYKRFKVIGNA